MKFLIRFIPPEIIDIVGQFLIEKENYNKVIRSIKLLPVYNSLNHSHDFEFYRQKNRNSIAFSCKTRFNYKQMMNKAISINKKKNPEYICNYFIRRSFYVEI